MKVEEHERKIKRMKNTIKKLDLESDYETIIEDCVLIVSHIVNAHLHKIGVLRIDKDIKHNKLFGELMRNNFLGKKTEKIALSIRKLEGLRPTHVYGKGRDGKAAKEALDILEFIEGELVV